MYLQYIVGVADCMGSYFTTVNYTLNVVSQHRQFHNINTLVDHLTILYVYVIAIRLNYFPSLFVMVYESIIPMNLSYPC